MIFPALLDGERLRWVEVRTPVEIVPKEFVAGQGVPGGADLQAGEEIGHGEVVEDLQGDLARQCQVEEGNVRQFIDVADQLVDQCQWLCFQFFRWQLDDRWLLRGGIRRRRRCR